MFLQLQPSDTQCVRFPHPALLQSWRSVVQVTAQPPGPGAGPLQRRVQATRSLMTSGKAEAPRPLLRSDSSLRKPTDQGGTFPTTSGLQWSVRLRRDASGEGGGRAQNSHMAGATAFLGPWLFRGPKLPEPPFTLFLKASSQGRSSNSLASGDWLSPQSFCPARRSWVQLKRPAL